MNYLFKNKKGFTIVEILAVIVILGILVGIAAPAVLKYIGRSSQQSYDIMAKSAKEGVESYLLDHPSSSGSLRIKQLIEDDYLEKTVDPEDQGEFCDGYVKYNLVNGDDETLDQYAFTVNLCCTEYEATYKYPEGTISEIEPSNFCSAIESVDPTTGDLSPAPTCTIKLSGTKKNGGYVSDVTVEMETEGIVLEKGLDVVRNSKNGLTKVVHTEDTNTITYYGYVKNDIGESTCQATFIKDATAPTCPTISVNVANDVWTNEDVKFDFTFDSDTDNYNWFTNTSSSEYRDWGNNAKTEISKTITSEGDRFVKLVVYDKYGNHSECLNDNKHYYIDKTIPTCTVNLNGTSGENGWYVEKNVAVSLSTNDNGGSTLDSFDLTTSASPTYAGNTSGSQGNTASTKWYGYVKDKAGNLGSCNKTVKVDMTPPTCTLKKSGTWNNGGFYTSVVTVSFDDKSDTGGSTLASYGLVTSTTPTYNSKSSVTQNATNGITWYGYVKDTAGNTATCNTGSFKVLLEPPKITFSLSGSTSTATCVDGNTGDYISSENKGLSTSTLTHTYSCQNAAGQRSTATQEYRADYNCTSTGRYCDTCHGSCCQPRCTYCAYDCNCYDACNNGYYVYSKK